MTWLLFAGTPSRREPPSPRLFDRGARPPVELGAGVAVLSDVVGIARSMLEGGTSSSPLGYTHWHPARISPSSEHEMMAYLRLVARDRPGILAKVCSILARHHINIDSVLQEPAKPKMHLPFVMTLEPTKEKNVARAVMEIARLGFNAAPPVLMPFADLS